MTRIYSFTTNGDSIDKIRKSIYTALIKVLPDYKRRDILITTAGTDVVRVIIFTDRIRFIPTITKAKINRRSTSTFSMFAEHDVSVSDRFNNYILKLEDDERKRMSIYYLDIDSTSFTIREGSLYKFDFKFVVEKGLNDNG